MWKDLWDRRPIGGFPLSGDHIFINVDSPRERLWAYKHEGGYIVPAEFGTWDEYLELVQERLEWWTRYKAEHGPSPFNPAEDQRRVDEDPDDEK